MGFLKKKKKREPNSFVSPVVPETIAAMQLLKHFPILLPLTHCTEALHDFGVYIIQMPTNDPDPLVSDTTQVLVQTMQ